MPDEPLDVRHQGKTRRRKNVGLPVVDTTVRLPEDVLIKLDADSRKTGKNNISWQVTEILERHYGIDRAVETAATP